MGWKNVREHYRIKHNVCVEPDKGICIGSGYVHDLIVIGDDMTPRWGHSHLGRGNDQLNRYMDDMSADLDKLHDLIIAPDTFEKSVTVYTYRMGEIIETVCEEAGWPNCTHDGQIMYENTFSTCRTEVVEWAKLNAAARVDNARINVSDTEAELQKQREWLAEAEAAVRDLEND